MGATRLCVFLTVLVSVKMMTAEPIFGSRIWCDLMCDDDDDDDYSDGDIFDYFFDTCGGCPTNKPSKSKTTTPAPGSQQPVELIIPPANGMNVTMMNTGYSWLLNFMPWASSGGSAHAATTAAPATTAAGTPAAGNSTAGNSTASG